MKYKARVKSMNQIIKRHTLRSEVKDMMVENDGRVSFVFFKDGTCINNRMKYGEEVILDKNPESFSYDYVDNTVDNLCAYQEKWLEDITPCYTMNIEGQEVILSSELYEQLKEKIEEAKSKRVGCTGCKDCDCEN